MAEWISSLGKETSLGEKTEFKPAVFCLKIDLVSHPGHGKGVGLIKTLIN